MHLRKLAELGSESAGTVLALEAKRDHIQEAMSRLRDSHLAQITLATILCGTRFKRAFQGVLVPTECPNGWRKKKGVQCGKEDSFEHLIRRHGLITYREENPHVVDLMVKMARKATPKTPGINILKYVI